MKLEVKTHPVHGRILMLSDEYIELAGALEFGIRIVYLSVPGKENLLYVQPSDLSDNLVTPGGWRIHGGHRFWAAPEGELSYYPDNDPVTYETLPDGFVLKQKTDPWTHMQKTLSVELDGKSRLRVIHTLTYEGDESVQAAAWGVTTLRGGGTAVFPFPKAEGNEFRVNRSLGLWGDTSLSDQRLSFSGDKIIAKHDGSRAYFKLGMYNADGRISMENLGQKLQIDIPVYPMDAYAADRGCNAELFMDPNVMELETLGETKLLKKGESVSHTEYWTVL